MSEPAGGPGEPEHPEALFSMPRKIQAWLDIEVALAHSQARLGMIPVYAAVEIARQGRLERLDQRALLDDMVATKAPIVSLVNFLAAACDGDAGGYVHWGATTQNVMQTGEVLLLREAHRDLLERLAGSLDALAGHAEQGATVVMAGRTQRRHALPITFGFKVAVWIDELLRHETRFREAEPRVFTLIFGGAVGGWHSFDGQGEALQRELAARLALGCFQVPSRAVYDHMVEYILLLGLLASTCAKIAQELFTLMSEEIGEVQEDLGEAVVGSSTMPQKVNPKLSVRVIALAARLRAQLGLALDAGQISHEGDAASSQMLYAAVDTACPLALEMITAFEELMRKLRIAPDAMRANLARSGGLVNAENLMMTLARGGLGRQRAHDLVHEAALAAGRSGRAFHEVLAGDTRVGAGLDDAGLDSALAPENYLGDCVRLAREQARRARRNAADLRRRAAGLN